MPVCSTWNMDAFTLTEPCHPVVHAQVPGLSWLTLAEPA